jgi:hypothetical protein
MPTGIISNTFHLKYRCSMLSPGLLYIVVFRLYTNVSREHIASALKMEVICSSEMVYVYLQFINNAFSVTLTIQNRRKG